MALSPFTSCGCRGTFANFYPAALLLSFPPDFFTSRRRGRGGGGGGFLPFFKIPLCPADITRGISSSPCVPRKSRSAHFPNLIARLWGEESFADASERIGWHERVDRTSRFSLPPRGDRAGVMVGRYAADVSKIQLYSGCDFYERNHRVPIGVTINCVDRVRN